MQTGKQGTLRGGGQIRAAEEKQLGGGGGTHKTFPDKQYIRPVLVFFRFPPVLPHFCQTVVRFFALLSVGVSIYPLLFLM